MRINRYDDFLACRTAARQWAPIHRASHGGFRRRSRAWGATPRVGPLAAAQVAPDGNGPLQLSRDAFPSVYIWERMTAGGPVGNRGVTHIAGCGGGETGKLLPTLPPVWSCCPVRDAWVKRGADRSGVGAREGTSQSRAARRFCRETQRDCATRPLADVGRQGRPATHPTRWAPQANGVAPVFRCPVALADGVGFEPTGRVAPAAGFQVRCIRPLCHPSGLRPGRATPCKPTFRPDIRTCRGEC